MKVRPWSRSCDALKKILFMSSELLLSETYAPKMLRNMPSFSFSFKIAIYASSTAVLQTLLMRKMFLFQKLEHPVLFL